MLVRSLQTAHRASHVRKKLEIGKVMHSNGEVLI